VAEGVPEISVYGDGQVITTTPVPKTGRQPAVPGVELRHIGQDDVQALVRRAVEAGVGSGADLGTLEAVDGSMDASTTLITVRTASGGLVTAKAPGLGYGHESGLTGAQRQARQKLADLIAALEDLPRTLGKGKADKAQPYEPALIAAVALAWAPVVDGQPDDQPLAWPGAALPGPGGADQRGISCVTTPAAPVLSAARRATVATPWTSGDQRWRVLIRPLLPGEHSCADLGPS
jgi:hypothetical protein